MVTLTDIAKDTNCSVSLVSRVLSGKSSSNIRVSAKTRALVQESAKRLGYQPNRNAEFLKRGYNPAIGIFLPPYRNGLVVDLVRGASETAEKNSFSVSFSFSFSLDAYKSFMETTRDRKNCGIVTYPFFQYDREALVQMERYLEVDGKIVQLCSGNPPAQINGRDTVYVMCDDYRGGELAAERLLADGCDEFCCILGVAERYHGFARKISKTTGLAPKIYDENDEGYSGLVKKCLRTKHSIGIFCMADRMATKLYGLLLRNGIDPGGRIKIIGYDALIPATCFSPSVTSIVQPMYEAASLAVEKLIALIFGGEVESSVLAPSISEGGTA